MPGKALSMLKEAIPRPLRRSLWRGLSTVAYRFADPEDREGFPCHHLSLKLLRAGGFRPSSCLDIGANSGHWTRLFISIFPETKILMLEAQESKRTELAELCAGLGGHAAFDIALLGSETGKEVVFYEMGTGSSVFAEIAAESAQAVTKAVQTVDDIVLRHPEVPAPFDFIKLDVQGYELEILRGATKALAHCEAVLMEASLMPYNIGGPLIADVMQFMHDKGFRLYDFCSQHRARDGTLMQTDLLFLREGSKFLPDSSKR